MIFKGFRPFWAALAAVSLCLPASAQEETSADEFSVIVDDALFLDTTVVTATRNEEPLFKSPFTTEVVDVFDLRSKLPRSFPEIFEEVPGVMIQKTANGQGSPFIRGFTAFRNLLLVDGIRLNHAAFREGPNQYWATLDPYAISQVEVVKSQGSTLYGSDSIGGTVNVRTKSADVFGYADGQHFINGNALYRWGSGEQTHTGRIETSFGIGGKTGIHIGYTVRDIGNIRAAELGELPKTGYSEWGLDARLDHYFQENVRFTLTYQQFIQDDVWRTHSTRFGRSWSGTSVGGDFFRILDQSRYLGYAKLDVDDLDGFVNEMDLTLSWHRHEERQDRLRSSRRRDFQGFDLDSLGASLQLGSDTSIGKLTYGASYYRDSGDTFRQDYNADGSFRRNRIQGPFGDDADYDLFGFFVQDQIELTDRLDVIVGGRYTYAAADIGRVEDPVTGGTISINDEWHNVSGSLRGVYDISGDDTFNVFGGLSQAFRAPNFSDLSRLSSARSSEIEVPSPGLDPEEFLTYELGTRVNKGSVSGGLSIFYTDINDLIVRTPTGRMIDGEAEVIKKNGATGYLYGVEANIEWQICDCLNIFGNFAWNDGKADTFPTSSTRVAREPVSRLLPATGLVGVHLDTSDKTWVELTGQFVDRQDRLNTRDMGDTQRIPPGGTPGYAVFNVRAGWQVTDNVLFTAAVENVTDEDYRAHGSGQNEPGVNFVLGASINFR